MTKSCGSSMPLFMHVGVVRMRSSSRRTEILPSQATIKPRSYNHFPAVQISRRCCSSLFWWVGKSGFMFMHAILPCPEYDPGRYPAPIQETCWPPSNEEPVANFITLGVDSAQL